MTAAAARQGGAVVPGATLLHPIVLLSIATFIVNDHVLKPELGGRLPGKISDVAGLIFFPVLVAALVDFALPGTRARRGEVLIVAAIATAVTYTAMLLVSSVGETYEVFFGTIQWPLRVARAMAMSATVPGLVPVSFAADPSDLITLPALIVPLALGIRIRRRLLA